MDNLSLQMVNCLLDAIDMGYITEETIGQFSYNYLGALLQAASELRNGEEIYLKIKLYLENINIKRIRKKEKIAVFFVANYASTWIGDGLYQLLDKSQRFEPYILLMPNHTGQNESMVKEEYERNLKYFQERDLRIVQAFHADTGKYCSWQTIERKPDICIWLTPWSGLFYKEFQLGNFPLDILCAYIPYGFMIAENEHGNFVYDQYNQLIHNLAWKIFEESKLSLEMAGKYSFIGNVNAVYTGYPKMDGFYEKKKSDFDIWIRVMKKSGNVQAKKIIYAPHHTINNEGTVVFSTFAYNYSHMLELARKYEKETLWVFKPHPQLKFKAIREGIFKDEKEWDHYVQAWKDLKNGEVMEEGGYQEMFLGSEAMILDSISFLAEYLYADRPALLLERKEQRFNDFGKRLKEVLYTANGQDKAAIEAFVKRIVLDGKDEKKEKRKTFFDDNLNYIKALGNRASENIYHELEKLLK